MEREDVYSKLVPVIADKLNVDEAEVVEGASFIDDLGADSLGMVDLAMALEDEFGITIPDEDLESIKTVGDAVSYIATV